MKLFVAAILFALSCSLQAQVNLTPPAVTNCYSETNGYYRVITLSPEQLYCRSITDNQVAQFELFAELCAALTNSSNYAQTTNGPVPLKPGRIWNLTPYDGQTLAFVDCSTSPLTLQWSCDLKKWHNGQNLPTNQVCYPLFEAEAPQKFYRVVPTYGMAYLQAGGGPSNLVLQTIGNYTIATVNGKYWIPPQ